MRKSHQEASRRPARGRRAALAWLGVAGLCAVLACSRSPDRLALTAPFNDATKIGEVSAVWSDTGDRREVGAGVEHRLQYRIDARNALRDPVYVRLGRFRLLDAEGEAAASETGIECALRPGLNEGILTGSVWITADRALRIRTFQLDRFAVPLSARGRAVYREWLLQRRPGAAAAIDADLGRYDAAPPCAVKGDWSTGDASG